MNKPIRAAGSTGDVTGYGHIARPDEVDTSHGPILYLDDITVSFDGFKALNRLSLTIERGELRCVIGPNGAGKTTMMDVITGKTWPMRVLRSSARHRPRSFAGDRDRAARHRSQVPEADGVREPTVFENLELAMKTTSGCGQRCWRCRRRSAI